MSKDPIYGAGYSAAVLANCPTLYAAESDIVNVVQLGEADAGFCYKSSSFYSGSTVQTLTIPDTYQSVPLPTYPIEQVKAKGAQAGSQQPAAAAAFISFVESAAGQKVMANWGFLPMPTPAITSLSPSSGPASTTPVTITGTNFFTTSNASVAAGTVKIGGVAVPAANTVWATNGTSITVTVPSGSLKTGANSFTVTSDGRTSNAATFTVQ